MYDILPGETTDATFDFWVYPTVAKPIEPFTAYSLAFFDQFGNHHVAKHIQFRSRAADNPPQPKESNSKSFWTKVALFFRALVGLPALREFALQAYKDPVWKIAALLFLIVFPWELSFWNSVPGRILGLEEPLQRTNDFTRHQTVVLRLQENVLNAMRSEGAASQFIHDKGLLVRPATVEDEKKCMELTKEARYQEIAASGAVAAVTLHEPLLAEFQLGLQRELQCVDTGLQPMAQICRSKNASKLDSLQVALFSNSLECLAAGVTLKDSYESDLSALIAEQNAAIKSEAIRFSIFRFDLLLAELGALYVFGFLTAVLLGWDRVRRRHLREGRY